MTTIHFNTSRLYQAHGQRITVQVNPDGTVLFNDHSRMIAGKLKATPFVELDDPRELSEYIMELYDQVLYDHDPEAMNLTYDPAQEHLFRI